MRYPLSLAIPLVLFGLAVAPVVHAQHDHHDHGTVAPAVVDTAGSADPELRWQTDAPLRQGMGAIRAAVAGLEHYEHGHMGPEQAVTLTRRVQDQIAYLVANCRLEPRADAALHVIIAKLGSGAQRLQDDPAELTAIAPMREAMQAYARQFDDPASTDARDTPAN